MNAKEIDDAIRLILILEGPDGHIDGHDTITSFVLAVQAGIGAEWVERYKQNQRS